MPGDVKVIARGLRIAVLCAVLLAATASVAGAGTGSPDEPDPTTPTTLPQLPDDAGHIIKHPNYGHEPTHAGDRGGWQQGLVVVLLGGGLTVIGLLVWRESRRRRAAGDDLAPRQPSHP
jgi:hypothetical protein